MINLCLIIHNYVYTRCNLISICLDDIYYSFLLSLFHTVLIETNQESL